MTFSKMKDINLQIKNVHQVDKSRTSRNFTRKFQNSNNQEKTEKLPERGGKRG